MPPLASNTTSLQGEVSVSDPSSLNMDAVFLTKLANLQAGRKMDSKHICESSSKIGISLPAAKSSQSKGFSGMHSFKAVSKLLSGRSISKVVDLMSSGFQASKGSELPSNATSCEFPVKATTGKIGPEISCATDSLSVKLDGKVSPKLLLAQKRFKHQVRSNDTNRLLVTVNVLGSAGSLRFLVGANDCVQRVAELTLQAYAREGRLPALGLNAKHFDLYCANSGSEALDLTHQIGTLDTRQFLLYRKKQVLEPVVHNTPPSQCQLWRNWRTMMSSIVCSH